MICYVDVILPLPIPGTFTYHLSDGESKKIKVGHRVAVSFRKSKIYTAIVSNVHNNKPENYQTKPIEFIYEENELVSTKHIEFWFWLSRYYFAPIGDVLKAAIPSTFLLESESIIVKNQLDVNQKKEMSDEENLLYEALDDKNLKISDVSEIINKKNIYSLIQKMIGKGYIDLNFELKDKYKPKFIDIVVLNKKFLNNEELKNSLEMLANSPKQNELFLFIKSSQNSKEYVTIHDIKKKINFSQSSLKGLHEKGLIEIKKIKIDRSQNTLYEYFKTNSLSPQQTKAFSNLRDELKNNQVVLLEGVTSSGKTEIFIKIIDEFIKAGKQVLYLVPEIALTTQIIQKLKVNFNNEISVFHSKYSINERTEVWENVKACERKASLIVGARSSIFLPFSNLGLIVVDEEHEISYKQQDPSPRYNARDSAIYLSKIFNSKVILGSATPSIETSFNAKNNKYGFVELKERFGNIEMPHIETIDMRTEVKYDFNQIFSIKLVEEINLALDYGKQVILFRNRRGYSPQWQCDSCGNNIMCDNCDVSLTYHQKSNSLRCHYCGFQAKANVKCSSCGVDSMNYKGDGTQQIEEITKEIFPNSKIARMDWDTTRGKWDFDKMINSFAKNEIDILIGTQMITKGLDFDNVSLVGVLNTDHFLNFPDFRAHEKAFQILTQVSGRSGRSGERGKVYLQTYQPNHPIIENVIKYDYKSMYENQLYERKDYKYPPFVRLIRIIVKDRSYEKLNSSTEWINNAIRSNFKGMILGPVYPEIARIKNKFHKEFLIKLKDINDLNNFRGKLNLILKSFDSITKYRSVKVIVDVDPI